MDNLVILKIIFTCIVLIGIWILIKKGDDYFWDRIEGENTEDYINRMKSTSKKK